MKRNALVASVVAVVASTAAPQDCEWSEIGRGVDDPVFTLTTFDDGSGKALYLGGRFQTVELTLIVNYVAKWDGRSWSALGPGLRSGVVYDLAVFDDGRGGGPALYAGGSFETSGGRPVRGIAKWDGASWSEVGGGIAGGASKPRVEALAVFDDGTGPALYAGGSFGTIGGVPGTSFIAKWDGDSWTPLGAGVGSYVRALTVFDDGTGPALYATGYLKSAGGATANYIAKWDGKSWSPLAGGLDFWALALGVFDDGAGAALYVGGAFTAADGLPARHIAKWNGSEWSGVGGGMDRAPWGFGVFDDGRGPALYVGGGFTMAGDTPAPGVARWDGQNWSAVGGGVSGLTTPGAYDFAVYDNGEGPALYAGGGFTAAGGMPAKNVVRWKCESSVCYADCDRSGDLTFFDFLCFQNLFAAMDPAADCDGDSGFTFFDFLCFQNAFAAGCP